MTSVLRIFVDVISAEGASVSLRPAAFQDRSAQMYPHNHRGALKQRKIAIANFIILLS